MGIAGAVATATTVAALLLALVSESRGSEGDRQPAYRACVTRCPTSGCATVDTNSKAVCPSVCSSNEPSAAIAALWSCQDDCRYRCMWAIEDSRKEAQKRTYAAYKYHGKWPFLRVLGMQELLSVLASLGNLAAHISGFSKLQRSVNNTHGKYPLYLWRLYFFSSCFAWVASAVFHSRDTHLTESLDYGAANVTIATGLWASITRCAGSQTGRWAGMGILIGLCFHIGHMHLVKFDYGRNMAVCIAAGVLQSCMWTSWVWMKKHPGRWTLTAFMVAVNTAMLLEVLDFPPLASLLDAHGAWHFATVPLVSMWYTFLQADVQWSEGFANPPAARKYS
mmetsp:Transcript_15915/g.44458  ORF Transcript_15915/g.44458 Transcript_15915/m.44458 type:complete len:336 (+) Transcript_15915:197-1204(+)|eukprot:CAMPEP_0117658344 /NCGR_PEP_ID=MMETSP0804-20121206/5816_1 /TAXON_ID=1074897 /ORGANISM="Tetraselmis astigmatica, Strain CCMP880" /LENGTH=335 /DNA_ID=CAMNT_0005464863 /DNA_START=123 /DNA_END=1130 /DNA_ORIENTATION=+